VRARGPRARAPPPAGGGGGGLRAPAKLRAEGGRGASRSLPGTRV